MSFHLVPGQSLGSVGEPGKGQGRKTSVCEKRWKIKYAGQSVNGPLKSANSLARINPKALPVGP